MAGATVTNTGTNRAASVAQILVVDDEPALCQLLQTKLEQDGHAITTAGSAEQALEEAGRTTFDVVLTDLRMGGMNGIGLTRAIKEQLPDTEVIIVSAVVDMEWAVSALQFGAFDTIAKPFNLEEVSVTVRRALERQRLVHENRLLQEGLLGDISVIDAFDADPWGLDHDVDDPTVGRMAGSAAHMINSPLSAILGFSELILGREDLDEEVRKFTRLIHEEGKKIREVTRRLRDLARREETSVHLERHTSDTDV